MAIASRIGAEDGRVIWADVEAARAIALAGTNAKGQASVRNVYDAAKALAEASTRVEITAAAVADWCGVHRDGRPCRQSIANNSRLRDLIKVAAAASPVASRRPAGVGARPVEADLLAGIPDAEVRAAIEAKLAHRRFLIGENAQLVAGMTRLAAIGVISREMAETGVETLSELAEAVRSSRLVGHGGPTFEAREVAACRAFLDAGLRALGLRVDEATGEVLTRHAMTVADAGFASAVLKVSRSRPV